MKYRQDFVTNSSSSSFIGVFAKIEDAEKAKKTIEDFKLEESILKGSAILEKMAGKWFFGYGADWAGVDLTPNKDSIDPNADYIYWREHGGAGDGDESFYEDEDGYELDYDVDLSDFPEDEQEIFNSITEDNGFSEIQDGYGAGRNG